MTGSVPIQLMLWIITCLFVCSCTLPISTDVTENHDELIDACRARFPEVHTNPSNDGGVAYVDIGYNLDRNESALCIYGSLRVVDYRKKVEILMREKSYKTIVVRSSGGPVQIWLSLAEALAGRAENLIVDDICMSSCANYIFPISKYKYVAPSALVVWHGGPTTDQYSTVPTSFQGNKSAALQAYARRTERLYAWLQIRPELLKITSRLSLNDAERSFVTNNSKAKIIKISGYALPPKVLSRCFGFSGLENMSHLGNIDKVFQLGQSKSSDLNVLVLPASYDPTKCSNLH